MFAEISAGSSDPLRVASNPVKFAGEEDALSTFPPKRGADTIAILTDRLGLSTDQLRELAEAE